MTDKLGQSLLQIARSTVHREVVSGDGRQQSPPPVPDDNGSGFSGAFVTLRCAGRLRGCVGSFKVLGTLARTVRDMAVSATHDSRFQHQPLQVDDLPNLSVEVSLLTAPVRTEHPLTLVPGRHGVLIRRDKHSGCLLPHVATENNWTAAEFLSRCCEHKASLPRDAWTDPRTEVHLFETVVFTDPAPGVQEAART